MSHGPYEDAIMNLSLKQVKTLLIELDQAERGCDSPMQIVGWMLQYFTTNVGLTPKEQAEVIACLESIGEQP